MKKWLYVFLATLCLTGCGNSEVITTETEDDVEETVVESEYVEEIEDESTEIDSETEEYTYIELNQTMYAKQSVNVCDLPCAEGNILGGLTTNQEVTVTGQCNETSWYRIIFDDSVAYVSNNYLVNEKITEGNISNSVPEEYKECYDTDRDGLVSDAEIDAYDRRFYGEAPTPNNYRIILKAGYNQVLSLTNEYTGEVYYAVMVSAAEGYSYACDLLDRFLLDHGLRALSNGGGSMDQERVLAIYSNIVAIDCTINYDVHGDVTGWACGWPDIAEEVYGYTSMDVVTACCGVGTEHITFVEKPEGGHLSYCDCGEGYQVVVSYEQIKAVLGIQ